MRTSKNQLRLLLARAHERREESNIRMARSIHDDISQQLTALSIELSLLQKRLGKHPEAAGIQNLLGLVGQISQSVRRTMNELRPKILDEFGLVAAMKYECQRLEKSAERKISFSAEFEDVTLDASRAGEIFRLFQEVLGYVLEVSADSEIRVQIRARPSLLGIDVKAARGRRGRKSREDLDLLLLNIRERMLRLGGRLALSSAGSPSFRMDLPLNRKNIKS